MNDLLIKELTTSINALNESLSDIKPVVLELISLKERTPYKISEAAPIIGLVANSIRKNIRKALSDPKTSFLKEGRDFEILSSGQYRVYPYAEGWRLTKCRN